ncbi:MAG: hypothetical protein R2710_01415 [Acidimicrobiales bacterium]
MESRHATTEQTTPPPPSPDAVRLPPPAAYRRCYHPRSYHPILVAPLVPLALLFVYRSASEVLSEEQHFVNLAYLVLGPYIGAAASYLWAHLSREYGARFSRADWAKAWLISYCLFVEIAGLFLNSPVPFSVTLTPA